MPEHGAVSEAGDIRLLLLCMGDPDDERPFSGSARSLFRALERRGCVHHKANVAGFTDPFARRGPLARQLARLDRFGIEDRYRWSSVAFARATRRAERIAAAHPGFNACLLYGTSLLPRIDAPLYCYLDATAAQVHAARAWEFARLSEAHARRVIERQRLVFEQCACVFPRTEWTAESVERDYRVPREKIIVASAGPNYYAQPLPHGPYNTRTILFIGSEFERKGGPLLIEAFRRVRLRIPEARLRIIGCEPQIAAPGVEILGRISKDAPGGLEQLLRHFSEASVFCIMSAFEPFGIVVIEAQNCLVPCVLPARFAFPEMVIDGVTGRLVTEYDPEMLAAALIELLTQPRLLEEMGRAAHAFVREHYTWAAAAARILDRIRADRSAT
ncbi:MAG TPA: glycosyltransferase family 4 protein [Candidatus Hydrogenedentes bacterium]|nr:glycosyltransferase family 4 protein [Candidatus Hydrogenedentota bacterium]HNT89308.1 glycosyltransferase family 4 protein [Candidatus Hydrogenedentota bacterium]